LRRDQFLENPTTHSLPDMSQSSYTYSVIYVSTYSLLLVIV